MHVLPGRASSRPAATTHSSQGGGRHESRGPDTPLCHHFFNTGYCRFGTVCRFIHSEQQQQHQDSSSWQWLRMATRKWLPLQLEPSVTVTQDSSLPNSGSVAAATASATVADAAAVTGTSGSKSSWHGPRVVPGTANDTVSARKSGGLVVSAPQGLLK